MSGYAGDIRLEDTIDLKFCTVDDTGAPTTLAGTPAISAYVGNGTTQITAGITLSVDFDGVTGLHNIRVVATNANGYAAATNVYLVITTGTVDSVSVVGYVVGAFSIEARSALMPTTVARKLDVSAGGEAGVDWANVGSPTTALNLSGTNIDTDQVVASVAGAVGSVTGLTASDVGAIKAKTDNLPAAPASTTNITGGTITTVTNLTNAPTSGDLTATMKSSVGTAVAASAVASVTGNVGGNVGGNVTGSVGSIATGGIAAASFAAGAIDATAIASNAIAAAKIASGAITSAKFAAGAVDAAALATDAANEVADALLDRASAVDGYTPRQFWRLVGSVLAGKLSGAGTTTEVFRDMADTKARVTATVDSSGNRSAITLDAT